MGQPPTSRMCAPHRAPLRHRPLCRYPGGCAAYRDGVAITFVTKNSWFIGESRFRATSRARQSRPTRERRESGSGRALHGAKLQAGDRGAAAAARKQWPVPRPHSAASSIGTPTADYQQVNIRFGVDSGPRARFTTPVLTGDLKMDAARIVTRHQIPPLADSYLEADDADPRAPGSRRRPLAVSEGEPAGSARSRWNP